jgi:hypothetical protein
LGAFKLLYDWVGDRIFAREVRITDQDYDESDVSPYYSAPLVRYSGQPGGGKTYDMTRMALYGGFRHRIPTFVQDTKGDIGIYHERILESLRDKKDVKSRKKLDYLENKVRFSTRSDGAEMIAVIQIIENKLKKTKERSPTMNLIVDEAGTLQIGNGIRFWNLASTLRNNVMICHASSHREAGDGGISALGREATRAVVLYPQYERTEYFGVEAIKTSVPLSKEKVYIDSIDRQLKTFTLADGDEPIVDGSVPEVLIHPVNPTRVKKMLI